MRRLQESQSGQSFHTKHENEGLKALEAREEGEVGISGFQWILMLVSTIIYYTIGAAVYTHYEYHDDDDGGKRHWTVVDALYFCTVSMSTVGYGDLSPSTPGTKAFTLLWILVGITCVFTQIGTCFGQLTAPVTRHGAMVLERAVNRALPRTQLDVDGDGESDFAVPRHWVMAYALTMMPSILLLLTLQFVFAGAFSAIEGWNFGDAMWHCFSTSTTVGYDGM